MGAPEGSAVADSAPRVTMANTKAEIVDAAVDAGLGDADDLSGYTKTQLLDGMG